MESCFFQYVEAQQSHLTHPHQSGFPYIFLPNGTNNDFVNQFNDFVNQSKIVDRQSVQQTILWYSCCFLLSQERKSLCECHMCKHHVILYLFVYSVPSWGPHAGCRQTLFTASYLLLYCMYKLWDSLFSGMLPPSEPLRRCFIVKSCSSLDGLIIRCVTSLGCKVQDLSQVLI